MKRSVASRRPTFCFSCPIPVLKASGRICEALYTRLSLTKAGMRRKLLDLAVAPILEALQMLSKWKLNDVNCKCYIVLLRSGVKVPTCHALCDVWSSLGSTYYSERQKKLRGLIASDWPNAQVEDAWSCQAYQNTPSTSSDRNELKAHIKHT